MTTALPFVPEFVFESPDDLQGYWRMADSLNEDYARWALDTVQERMNEARMMLDAYFTALRDEGAISPMEEQSIREDFWRELEAKWLREWGDIPEFADAIASHFHGEEQPVPDWGEL